MQLSSFVSIHIRRIDEELLRDSFVHIQWQIGTIKYKRAAWKYVWVLSFSSKKVQLAISFSY